MHMCIMCILHAHMDMSVMYLGPAHGPSFGPYRTYNTLNLTGIGLCLDARGDHSRRFHI